MKILLEYDPAYVSERTGVPMFVKNIYAELCKDPSVEVKRTPDLRKYLQKYMPIKNEKLFRFIEKILYRQLFIPLQLLCGRYDYFLVTSYMFTPFLPIKRTKIASFVYDIGLLLYDDIQHPDITKHWCDVFMQSLKHYDLLITISASSRDDIAQFLQKTEYADKKLDYIYCDADIIDVANEQEQDLSELGIDNDYFLFLGTIEPRKNPLQLVQGFHYYKSLYNDGAKLVFAGKKGWLYEPVIEYIDNHNLSADVIFLDYVSDHLKVHLVRQAIAFVFLSKYEGFGIPPLEALKLGATVIVSDLPVFRELYEDSVHYVDPLQPEKIASAMADAVNNPVVIEDGLFNKFGWSDSEKKLVKILKYHL